MYTKYSTGHQARRMRIEIDTQMKKREGIRKEKDRMYDDLYYLILLREKVSFGIQDIQMLYKMLQKLIQNTKNKNQTDPTLQRCEYRNIII